MAEVNASFQKLTHCELWQRHGPALLFSGLSSAELCRYICLPRDPEHAQAAFGTIWRQANTTTGAHE
jgi:hypothetical protein